PVAVGARRAGAALRGRAARPVRRAAGRAVGGPVRRAPDRGGPAQGGRRLGGAGEVLKPPDGVGAKGCAGCARGFPRRGRRFALTARGPLSELNAPYRIQGTASRRTRGGAPSSRGGPMALTPSQRPTREWPLLILTLALVGLVFIPLAQALAGDSALAVCANWDAERWAQLLLGPAQFACYCCFTSAGFILLSR